MHNNIIIPLDYYQEIKAQENIGNIIFIKSENHKYFSSFLALHYLNISMHSFFTILRVLSYCVPNKLP